MPRKPMLIKIETIDPPEKAVVLQQYPEQKLSDKLAMQISQKLRKLYVKFLGLRKFGEMENAILGYDLARSIAVVDKKIVGAIAFHFDSLSELIFIDHVGTLLAPKGTGTELVRTAVEAAFAGGVGMSLESTPEAVGFWQRLGFKQSKKFFYIFEADFKRVREIKKALGTVGRVKDKK